MNRDPDSYRHLTDDQIIKKIIQLNKEIQQSTEKHGIDLSKIEAQPLHWLWQQRILLGNLTILDGDPGLGKSLLALDLAARITAGKPMPDDTPGPTGIQGSVILIGPGACAFRKPTSCAVSRRACRSRAPATWAVLPSVAAPGPRQSSMTRSGTNPSTASAMSVSHEPRRNSPSV